MGGRVGENGLEGASVGVMGQCIIELLLCKRCEYEASVECNLQHPNVSDDTLFFFPTHTMSVKCIATSAG